MTPEQLAQKEYPMPEFEDYEGDAQDYLIDRNFVETSRAAFIKGMGMKTSFNKEAFNHWYYNIHKATNGDADEIFDWFQSGLSYKGGDWISVGTEFIICSAIYYNNGIKYEHQPKNIETGMVFCGRRHHNCFMPLSVAFPQRNKEDVQQGFITNKDRFVDRKEAAEIAFKNGQISKSTNQLFSEDLF